MHEDSELLDILQHNGVEITKLPDWEEQSYLSEWFNRVVPEDKRRDAFEMHCFPGYYLHGDSVVFGWGFLWHVFSSRLLDCLEEDDARKEFSNAPKNEAILLDYLDRSAYILRNISNLLVEYLDVGDDIMITDINFEWTYAKTHEEDLGPYFHNIRSK